MTKAGGTSGGTFSPLAMIVVVLVGAVALAGLGVLSSYAPELRSGDDGREHALSKSSVGYGALPRLLRATGSPVVLSRGPLPWSAADSLLILTPPAGGAEVDLDAIAHEGPLLIVLPKWGYVPAANHPGWVSTVDAIPPDAALSVLPEALRTDTRLSEITGRRNYRLLNAQDRPIDPSPISIEDHRRIDGDGWMPIVTDTDGAAVLAMHHETGVYVLTDADLLNTQGLKSLTGARTALALLGELRSPRSPVVFDLTLYGFQRTRNLGRLMLEPPFLGMTLALVALAAFAGWQAMARFGPPIGARRVVPLGKRSLADNTAGLVRMARRERHMATPYALLVRAAAARAIGAPRDLEGEALDAFLDRVGATLGVSTSYTDLARAARSVRNPGELIRVARDLHRWTKEMTRARQ